MNFYLHYFFYFMCVWIKQKLLKNKQNNKQTLKAKITTIPFFSNNLNHIFLPSQWNLNSRGQLDFSFCLTPHYSRINILGDYYVPGNTWGPGELNLAKSSLLINRALNLCKIKNVMEREQLRRMRGKWAVSLTFVLNFEEWDFGRQRKDREYKSDLIFPFSGYLFMLFFLPTFPSPLSLPVKIPLNSQIGDWLSCSDVFQLIAGVWVFLFVRSTFINSSC